MIIEYDKLYSEYVVWKKEEATLIEVYKSKNKKDCTNYIRKYKKEGKKWKAK